jgi:hypothetical protein
MTPRLSDEMRQAIQERGGAPVFVIDADTNTRYVLIKAEQYERIKAVAGGGDVEAMYAVLADIEPDDWEDSSHYDRKT